MLMARNGAALLPATLHGLAGAIGDPFNRIRDTQAASIPKPPAFTAALAILNPSSSPAPGVFVDSTGVEVVPQPPVITQLPPGAVPVMASSGPLGLSPMGWLLVAGATFVAYKIFIK